MFHTQAQYFGEDLRFNNISHVRHHIETIEQFLTS